MCWTIPGKSRRTDALVKDDPQCGTWATGCIADADQASSLGGRVAGWKGGNNELGTGLTEFEAFGDICLEITSRPPPSKHLLGNVGFKVERKV